MWSKIKPHTIWKCIDEDSSEYGKYCVIREANTHPDFNGDGDIELLYSNRLKHYGKVRRFIPGITHTYIKDCRDSSKGDIGNV